MNASLLLLLIVFFVVACNNEAGHSKSENDTMMNPSTAARENTDGRSATADSSAVIGYSPLDETSTKFIVSASNAGQMNIELARQAQEKGGDPSVKAFAAMIERDHQKAAEALSNLSKKKNYAFPDPSPLQHQQNTEALRHQQGKGFDKAYINMMVDVHRKTIDQFEKAGRKSKDDDIKAYIKNILPVLRMHLDSAKAIGKRII